MHNETTKTPLIYERISKVMQDVGSVGKDKKNTHDKYQYRSIDAVYNALQPILSKHSVFFAPTVLNCEENNVKTKSGASQVRVVLTVKYTIYTTDGSSVETVVYSEGIDRSDKAYNKALQAAYKYLIVQVFCISYKGMEDADKTSPINLTDPNVIKGGQYKGQKVTDLPLGELQTYVSSKSAEIEEKKAAVPGWFLELKKEVMKLSNIPAKE